MNLLYSAWRIFWVFLRELGDENAYQRHLNAHGLRHSGREWQRFSDTRLERKYRRPKCC